MTAVLLPISTRHSTYVIARKYVRSRIGLLAYLPASLPYTPAEMSFTYLRACTFVEIIIYFHSYLFTCPFLFIVYLSAFLPLRLEFPV